MRLELEGVEVWADEWRERCSTTIQAAGAYVIVVETVVPSRTAGLSSCYLADLNGRNGGLAPAPRARIAAGVLTARAERDGRRDAPARVPARSRRGAAGVP